MFKERVVIPPSPRRRVLKQFHSNHPGTNRMKSITRGYPYWPGTDKDIEVLVKGCLKCQLAAKGPPRENPIPWPETKKPWNRVHVDFAGPINGVTYLVLVDSHSKWPEVITMASAGASATISALNNIFATHGLPETIVSDNGTQFTSAQFREYCTNSEIWIRHRNQLYRGQVENPITPSILLSFLFDIFKLASLAQPQTSESPQKQSIQRPKRPRKQPRRPWVNSNSKSYEESAA